MKKFILLIAFCFLVCGCASDNLSDKTDNSVTCSKMYEIINSEKNAMLIDVRTEDEYNEGHIKGAINIPYEEVVQILSTYGNIDFDVPIVVYCASGMRSAEAYNSLVEAGYNNVYNLGSISNCD